MSKLLTIVSILLVAIVVVLYLLPNKTEYVREDTTVFSDEPDVLIIPPLAERVGQLIAIGHWTDTSPEFTADLVSKLGIGSVIIMQTPPLDTTISDWTKNWQIAASGTPLLISIDQEGGVVSRLKGEEYIQTAQPDIVDTATAYAIASKRAEELISLGINANYAPVVDQSESPASFMYQRVFRDSTMIGALANAMVRGYQNNDVLAVPKHYPGHPDTSDDSHLELPVLDISVTEYIDHTKQFSELIAAGNTKILMTAHVLVPAVDSEYPATLSPAVLNDLRERIGFQGVIITDDLAMKAVSNKWSHEEAAILALQAGADMIMLSSRPEYAAGTITAIMEAVQSGSLSEARINEAYKRVMSLKQEMEKKD